MSYIYAFLGFAALIVLHEAGHFLAAKAVGMRVERFSLFFGPMWLKKRLGETEYGVGVIPLGGYVRITGMTPDETYETPEIEARAYYHQPVWKRIVVITAGPAVNLIIAFVLLWAFYFHIGYTAETKTVGGVLQHGAAASVLKPGDRLVSVDGVTGGPEKLRAQVDRHRCAGGARINGCRAKTPAKVVVRRGGRLRSFEIAPTYDRAASRMLLGFEFGTRRVPMSVGAAAHYGVSDMWWVTKETVSAIGRFFLPQERKQLHGIVGAYDVSQQEFATSPSQAFRLLALVSLSLAVVNLFPFLPLDGGHIFWAAAEKLRGRRIPWRVMERAGFVGFALIALLFVIGLTNDISTIAGPGFQTH